MSCHVSSDRSLHVVVGTQPDSGISVRHLSLSLHRIHHLAGLVRLSSHLRLTTRIALIVLRRWGCSLALGGSCRLRIGLARSSLLRIGWGSRVRLAWTGRLLLLAGGLLRIVTVGLSCNGLVEDFECTETKRSAPFLRLLAGVFFAAFVFAASLSPAPLASTPAFSRVVTSLFLVVVNWSRAYFAVLLLVFVATAFQSTCQIMSTVMQ